mmetsp:Transcript_3514/g.9664  ORF Transcript_3514/g.9664 Transcript_3514/m.9664 type:complete len:245 (+) Transcript_3514:353-1087(+)
MMPNIQRMLDALRKEKIEIVRNARCARPINVLISDRQWGPLTVGRARAHNARWLCVCCPRADIHDHRESHCGRARSKLGLQDIGVSSSARLGRRAGGGSDSASRGRDSAGEKLGERVQLDLARIRAAEHWNRAARRVRHSQQPVHRVDHPRCRGPRLFVLHGDRCHRRALRARSAQRGAQSRRLRSPRHHRQRAPRAPRSTPLAPPAPETASPAASAPHLAPHQPQHQPSDRPHLARIRAEAAS